MRDGALERDPSRVIDLICKHALQLAQADYAGVRLMDDRASMRWSGMKGNRTERWRDQRSSSHSGGSHRALREGRTVVTRTRDLDPPPTPGSVREYEGGQVELATPLTYSGRPLGALVLGWRTEITPSTNQIRTAELLAGYGATVLDNARSHNESERRRAEAEALAELVRAGAAEENPDAAIGLICDQGRDLLGADYAAVVEVGQDQHRTWHWTTEGQVTAGTKSRNRGRGLGATARVLKTGRAVLMEDIQNATDVSRFHQFEGGQTAVVAPCIGRNGFRGALHFGWRRALTITPAQLRLAEALAGYATVILENVRANNTLRSANEQLQRIDQMKSNLISNVSHELRTPLSAIRAFSELLVDQDVDSETRVEFTSIINAEAERLTRLVTNLLDLSRIQARSVTWQIQPVDVHLQLEAAVSGLRPLAEGKNLTLDLDAPADLPWALADADGLQQVLVNVISNAIKFTAVGRVSVRAEHDGGFVVVLVSDTGPGIREEDQARIFERFYQTGDVLTSKPTGSGLGLAITKEILGQLNSDLRIHSVVGQGSTFSFALPIAS